MFFFENDNYKHEQLDLRKYKNTEEAKSKLVFVLSYEIEQYDNMWPWHKWWKGKHFIDKEKDCRTESDGRKILFKSYDFKKFSSEETAVETLKDFEKYCKENDILFSVKERKIQN